MPEKNFKVYSYFDSKNIFQKNQEVTSLIQKFGIEILPIVCLNDSIFRVQGLLSIPELEKITGFGISIQRNPTDTDE